VTANRLDDADTLLQDIRLADQDARYEQLLAQIQLGREAARSPEVEALEAAMAANPDDHATRIQLAIQLSQVAQYRDALEHLLIVLRADRDFNDGEARKVFLDTLATIGKGDPLAAEYQRKLFSVMY
jgi:putative thioredoxin